YTVGGTATSGTDYQSIGTSVVIPANEAAATVVVTPINDSASEESETVGLTLASGSGYTLGAQGGRGINLRDGKERCDGSIVALDPNVEEANEKAGTFLVKRTGDLSLSLTVSYTVTGTATPGTDYQTLSGSVLIRAGLPSATITVKPIDDSSAEPTETVIA